MCPFRDAAKQDAADCEGRIFKRRSGGRFLEGGRPARDRELQADFRRGTRRARISRHSGAFRGWRSAALAVRSAYR